MTEVEPPSEYILEGRIRLSGCARKGVYRMLGSAHKRDACGTGTAGDNGNNGRDPKGRGYSVARATPV